MFSHVKSGTVRMGETDMDYIIFGRGEDVLIMLPDWETDSPR